MQLLITIASAVQVLSALGVIVLVLLQHGKGADMGAAFGSGSSGSLFGATGSANFLSRLTAGLATIFFICTLGLAFAANYRPQAPESVMDRMNAPVDRSIPTLPGSSSGAVPPAGSAVPAAPAEGDASKKEGAAGIPK